MLCIYCEKTIPQVEFKCFKCGIPYCSRECQVKNVQSHRNYCLVRPGEYVGKLIREIEPKLRTYCYCMRKANNTIGDIYIIRSSKITNESKKIFEIKYGEIPHEDAPRSTSTNEYIIYIATNDYRGYYKYPMEGLNDINIDLLPKKLFLHTRSRSIKYAS